MCCLSVSYGPHIVSNYISFPGIALCCASATCSSFNIAQHSEQNLLGLLCLFGSSFSAAPVALDAKHQGKYLSMHGVWNNIQISNNCIYLILYFYSFLQIVEPFTAHYVFALGVARFLSCAHWVLQVLFFLSPFLFYFLLKRTTMLVSSFLTKESIGHLLLRP